MEGRGAACERPTRALRTLGRFCSRVGRGPPRLCNSSPETSLPPLCLVSFCHGLDPSLEQTTSLFCLHFPFPRRAPVPSAQRHGKCCGGLSFLSVSSGEVSPDHRQKGNGEPQLRSHQPSAGVVEVHHSHSHTSPTPRPSRHSRQALCAATLRRKDGDS